MENCDIQTKLNSDKRDAHAMAWAFTYLFSQCVATLPTDDRRKVPRYIISKRLCLELGGIKLKSIMKKVKALLLSTIIVVMFNGCAKDGETGPQGPQGNANVSSLNLVFVSTNWVHIGTAGQPDDMYQLTTAASIITSDIVNKGSVLVYVSSDGGTHYTALPFTFYGSNYSESWTFSYSANELVLNVQDSDHLTPVPNAVLDVKIITTASSNKIKNPNVDWNNYDEVKSALNLMD